jgi:hypothetical protein
MSGLSTDELTQMRADAATTLGDTVDIKRPSLTNDAYGGVSLAPSTVATGVACRVVPYSSKNAGMQILSERPEGVMMWTVVMPYGTSVQSGDQLLYGSRTLDVIDVDSPRSYEATTICFCKEFRRA